MAEADIHVSPDGGPEPADDAFEDRAHVRLSQLLPFRGRPLQLLHIIDQDCGIFEGPESIFQAGFAVRIELASLFQYPDGHFDVTGGNHGLVINVVAHQVQVHFCPGPGLVDLIFGDFTFSDIPGGNGIIRLAVKLDVIGVYLHRELPAVLRHAVLTRTWWNPFA